MGDESGDNVNYKGHDTTANRKIYHANTNPKQQ